MIKQSIIYTRKFLFVCNSATWLIVGINPSIEISSQRAI